MVKTCHYCERQASVPRPFKRLRHHYSLWEPESGRKNKFFYVCGDDACEEAARNDSSFMPSVIDEHLKEWVRFVFVRGAVTDRSTSGVTMDQSIIALRSRLKGDDLRVLEGLAELKKNQDKRNSKIYDPFFRDHCSQLAVSEFKLLFASGDWPGIWFLAIAAVMRLNQNLLANYVDLWLAQTKSAAKAVLQRCINKNSITQLGITTWEEHKQDLLDMWEDSRKVRWREKAEQCVKNLVEGTSFQKAIKDWNPGRRPSLTACASPEHFRAYFVGKLLHRANSECTYLEFPGGSLIRKGASTGKILLSDLMHGLDADLENLSVEQRCRWWSGAAQRFRDVAHNMYPGLFPEMEDGEIEHGACEFVRMCRKLYKMSDKSSAFMLRTILEIFESAASDD